MGVRGPAPGISPAEFAREIGVSQPTISRAISDGRIARALVRHGKRWRITDVELAKAELRENTRERIADPETDRPVMATRKSSGPTTAYQKERAQKMKADRELAELRLAQLRGELVPVGDAARVFGEALASIRSSLLALPDRLAVDLAVETDSGVVRERIRSELREILAKASDAVSGGGE